MAARSPRVLVVGAGHAGLACAHGVLAALPAARVVLFEPSESHLLKPRLHEAVGGDVSLLSVPLAPLIRSPRIEHVRAAVAAVDAPRPSVVVRGKRWEGDFLVIASGARTRAPAGMKPHRRGVSPHFRLDGIHDVVRLRRHLERCLARASGKVSAASRRELLSVLVVGGGYTGVETSAELALYLRRRALESGISPALVHVTLCEASERLFAGVPDDELAQRVEEGLSRKAVDVRTREEVRFRNGVPMVGGARFPAATVLLATGIEGAFPADPDFAPRSWRWSVDHSLRVTGTEGILAVGDAAAVHSASGPVAPSAQHAVQEGKHAAGVIAALVKGRPLQPFRPSTLGEFLTLGDGDVVGWIQFAGRRLHLGGLPAATARAAAFARYLAGLKLGSRVR